MFVWSSSAVGVLFGSAVVGLFGSAVGVLFALFVLFGFVVGVSFVFVFVLSASLFLGEGTELLTTAEKLPIFSVHSVKSCCVFEEN